MFIKLAEFLFTDSYLAVLANRKFLSRKSINFDWEI